MKVQNPKSAEGARVEGRGSSESLRTLSHFTFRGSRFTHHASGITKSPFRHSSFVIRHSSPAFTLIEILIAIGILGMVLAAIFSSWTAILRASKVGLDAAAAVQRARIVMRTIEDSLLCAQSFGGQNQRYYGFLAANGSDASLSFVTRLPESFPRNRKFGDLHVRRVTFSVESGPESSRQLVLRQSPLLMELDRDENEHPLVLAKYVSEFQMEFWDPRTADWVDEWRQTNQLPKLVKISVKLADNASSIHRPQQELTRIVNLPATMVQPGWQLPIGGPGRGPNAPGNPNQPGINPNPLQPGQQPGTTLNPRPGFRPQ